jgi:membrane protein
MQVKRLLRDLAHHFLEDDVQNVGAMMAYYAVISLFPMIAFVLTLALVVLDPDTVRQGLHMATETVPASVRDVLARRVDALLNAVGAKFAVLSALLALWSASRGVIALMAALNRMYHVEETRSWLRRQAIAILVTAGVAVLIVVALSLLLLGPYVGHRAADRFGLSDAFDVAWRFTRWTGAGLLVMLVWAITYKFLPNTHAQFRIFTPGAIAGVLLWLAISSLFGLYLAHFSSYEATYGALGGAIIFLTWLWLSNIALLVGAEINDVVAGLREREAPEGDRAEHVHDAVPAR